MYVKVPPYFGLSAAPAGVIAVTATANAPAHSNGLYRIVFLPFVRPLFAEPCGDPSAVLLESLPSLRVGAPAFGLGRFRLSRFRAVGRAATRFRARCVVYVKSGRPPTCESG